MKSKNLEEVKIELIQYLQRKNLSFEEVNRIVELFQKGAKGAIDDARIAIEKELESIKNRI